MWMYRVYPWREYRYVWNARLDFVVDTLAKRMSTFMCGSVRFASIAIVVT